MKKKHINQNKEKYEEILPKNPKKIEEDLPHNYGIFHDEAKLSKDTRNQFFVRFPRKVSEHLDLENATAVEFIVKIPLPEGKPEDSKLEISFKRKK